MMIKKLAIVGQGRMGSGIAQYAAMQGYDILLYGRNAEKVEKAITDIAASYGRAIQKGRMTEESREAALAHIRGISDLSDVASADFVIECVAEDKTLKSSIFTQLNGICPENVIFASNTSAISISSLAVDCGRPDRFVGTHFFNPVPSMKLVEIVRGIRTSDATLTETKDFIGAMGKVGVIVSDTPAFLVNRLMHAFRNEAMNCLQEGVASMEDIDTAVKLGLGHPMGPFELNDYAGLDIGYAAATTLYENFKDPKWRPNLMVKKLVEAGDLGRKTGKGWYDYTSGEKKVRDDIHF